MIKLTARPHPVLAICDDVIIWEGRVAVVVVYGVHDDVDVELWVFDWKTGDFRLVSSPFMTCQ